MFITATKTALVEALRETFDDEIYQVPDAVKPRRIDIEYPLEEEDWPFLLVELHIQEARWTGINADEDFETDPSTDSFDRADSATSLGSSDTEEDWTAGSGTWGIDTNQAQVVSGADAVATFDTTREDGTLSVLLTISGTTDRVKAGVVFRYIDESNYLLVKLEKTSGVDSLELLKREGGSYTVLESVTSFGLSEGTQYALEVTLDEDDISVSLDAEEQIEHTLAGGDETTFASGTRVGLWADVVAGADDAGSRWDDLSWSPRDLQYIRRGYFSGYFNLEVQALTSVERDRIWDLITKLFLMGRKHASTSRFFEKLEDHDLIAITVMEGAPTFISDSIDQGAPWSSEVLVAEATIQVGCVGEFYADEFAEELVPVKEAKVYSYTDLDTPPAGLPGGTWTEWMPDPVE